MNERAVHVEGEGKGEDGDEDETGSLIAFYIVGMGAELERKNTQLQA